MNPKLAPAKQRLDRIVFRTATPIGAALPLTGQIGARTGIVTQPRDPHHLTTLIIGSDLNLIPVRLATASPSPVRAHRS